MIKYALGFIYHEMNGNLLLIKKNKPDFQKGRLNGIGGRVEEGETAMQAMVREAEEELACSGVEVLSSWEHFATMACCDAYAGGDVVAEVYCFVAYGVWGFNVESKANDANEPFYQVDPHEIEAFPIMANLSWLVPMSRDLNRNSWPLFIYE